MLPVISIILARGGSKRLPGKNLKPFYGKPLIAHTIETAIETTDFCYVSTDLPTIAKVLDNYPTALALERPAELSQDTSLASEVLEYVFREQLQSIKDCMVVFLNCTSPLRTTDDVQGALKVLRASSCETLLSASKNCKFFWDKAAVGFEARNYEPSARPRSQDMAMSYQENGAIYISTTEYIREHNGNWLDKNSAIYIMPESRSFEIDNLADFQLCEALMEFQQRQRFNERLAS